MNPERVYKIVLGPHMSEKAANVAEDHNQIALKVARDASRREIKKAVEQLFDVEVESVRTLVVKGKVKHNRFGETRRPTWKKAYVRLKQGQDIDFAVADY